MSSNISNQHASGNTIHITGPVYSGTHPVYTNNVISAPNTTIIDLSAKILSLEKEIFEIQKRLLILKIDEDLHKKYPALKEAYDHYKLIEKIISEQTKKSDHEK